jgi:DNA polymerase II small subunit
MDGPVSLLARHGKILTPQAERILSTDSILMDGLVRHITEGGDLPFIIGETELISLLGPMPDAPSPQRRPPHVPPPGPKVEQSIARIAEAIALQQPVHIPRPIISPAIFEASEAEGDYRLIFDPAEHMGTKGRIEDFHRLFQDRYRTVRDLLRKQHGSLQPLEDIGRLSETEDQVRLIGMVQNVKTTKNGHTMFDLEDPTGSIRVLVSKNKEIFLLKLADDETVGIVGRFSKDNGGPGIVFADELVRPDIPTAHRRSTCTDPGAIAAFISDIHAGSKHFLHKEWRRMVRWLNGDGGGTLGEDISRRVKYLVVDGDLVDGIGIYPDQQQDLELPDISRQYEMLAELLSGIPSHIHIVMVPGNHDAVRLAEPQPQLPKEYAECFSNENIHFVTNPAFFSLSGVNVTAYHGKSIDDMVQLYKEVTYENPLEGMKEMLRSRHMSLTYGMRNQLSPEEIDMMVLREVPDVFVTGHVHRFGFTDYKGVQLIQAGTWQSQTSFQKMMNFKPQPAKMALLDLTTFEMRTYDATLT